MSALAPLTDPAVGGAGLAVTASDPQNIPPPASMLPANQQLPGNPMLAQHPLGAYTDSQYEAQDALLRNQIAKQYADLLQKLGYRDQNGNFVMGSVETEADKQNSELQRQQQLATEGVTQDAQRNGTLFSGMRGTLQARAEDPYVRQRADLMSSVPLQLQQLYEHASGLQNDYVLGQNQLLADAATRAAQGLIVQPPGAAAPAPPPPPDPSGAPNVALPVNIAPSGLPTSSISGQPILERAPGATTPDPIVQAQQALKNQGFGGARMFTA